MAQAKRDENYVTTLLGVSNADGSTPVVLWADPVTHRLLVDSIGGAPDDATYIVQTANATLTNEQALSTLATGIVKNTTGTGVLSIAVAGTDYLTPTGSGAGLTGIVTSITGTANQVIASAATGAVTLSTPQDIATTSDVTFGSLKLSATDSGIISDGNGVLNFTNINGDGYGFEFTASNGTTNNSNGGNLAFTAGNGTVGDAGGGYIDMVSGDAAAGTDTGGAIFLSGGRGGSTGGQGGNLDFTGGNSRSASTGGRVSCQGGTGGVTGQGGFCNLVGGNGGSASGIGGTIYIQGGNAQAGNSAGGPITLLGGDGQGTGNGGAVTFTGGESGAGATGNGAAVNLVGGAAASTNGSGGSVVLTGGAKTGTGIAGGVRVMSILCRTQAAATAKTTSATLTAAELLTGIVTINQGAGATSAQQLPTGTDIAAALPSDFTTGDSFDISFINISTVDAEDATVTTNTDLTLVGSMDFPAHSAITVPSSGILRFRKTGATTFTIYRIA